MEQFLAIISSFPTLIYSILLGVVVIYWLIAALGLFDIDIGTDAPDTGDADSITGLSGMLLKLGLNGVPITIVITCLSLYGWLACYFIMLFLSPFVGEGGWWTFLLGIPVLLSAFIVSVPVSTATITPLRRIFAKTQTHTQSTQGLIGKVAVIRTSKVTATFGEATFDDGGAGLILKVRADEPNQYNRGDRVLLLEFISPQHTYKIIPEQDLYDG